MTDTTKANTKSYWLSWWQTRALGGFELYSPWWISGSRYDGAQSICAAVRAASEDDAQRVVIHSYDKSPDEIEFRFVEEMKTGVSPFTDRFPRADWMRWDEPAESTAP